MAAYREAAELADYGPPEERERRTRCPACNAFIPREPTFEGGWMEVDRDYGHDSFDGGWVPQVDRVREWYDPTTDCKRCGRIWLEDELWQ